MNKLDDIIENASLSYRERIELAVGDKRGNFVLTDELDEVEGGRDYAEERIKFWKDWNSEYASSHKEVNTQERFVKAQIASKDYSMAVYKSLVSLICSKINEASARRGVEASTGVLQEMLWIYAGGSVLIMKKPLGTVQHIARCMKKINFPVGMYLDMKFKNASDSFVKDWMKKVA